METLPRGAPTRQSVSTLAPSERFLSKKPFLSRYM